MEEIPQEIMDFNRDQIEHLQILQRQVVEFTNKLLEAAIEHDTSKWSDKEYPTFVGSRTSLRGSETGKDEAYQKNLMSDAIQHHIKNNPHHAEYWDERGKRMPVYEIISMYFDWKSRSLQKGQGMEGFWQFNLDKLKNQPHAISIVESLKADYGD